MDTLLRQIQQRSRVGVLWMATPLMTQTNTERFTFIFGIYFILEKFASASLTF